jgi:hypothetical protein
MGLYEITLTEDIYETASLTLKTFHCALILFVDIFHHTTIDPNYKFTMKYEYIGLIPKGQHNDIFWI